MMPYICKIGPFTIFSYGLMLTIAFLVAGYLASRQAKREGLNPEEIFNFCFFIFIAGIIGCRLLYVLLNLDFYLRNPWEIIMLQHGGMAWFGGVILGSAAGWIYLRRRKLPVLKILDLIIPYVALAQAIGRIGCFLNGCCYGKLSASGVYFPALHETRLPTQLYSSLLLLIIFAILRFLQQRKHLTGQILAAYLFLYSLKRFFMEFLRDDSPRILWGLTIFQLLSIAMFISAIVLFLKIKEKQKK